MYNTCQWHFSLEEVLSKCILDIHWFKFCLKCPAFCSSPWLWFLVLYSRHCCCCSFCSGAGTETGPWMAFGSSVSEQDSVAAHHVKLFIGDPVVKLAASFQLDKWRTRWVSWCSSEPAQLSDTLAVNGLPGMTAHITHCAGLVRSITAERDKPMKWRNWDWEGAKVFWWSIHSVFSVHSFHSAVMVIWNVKMSLFKNYWNCAYR